MTSSSSSSPEISSAARADPHGQFSYKNATHDEVMEDLSSRFILNLPDEELASLERICFQVEQAHWFYEDFIREENPKFPSLPLKKFSAMLFHACPLLQRWSHDHEQAFNNFMQYKTRVPVCGAIMLNETWEKCLLVKGWKSSSGWGFPKGKINEAEAPSSCAVREVLEETGYNLASKINPDNVIELSIKEQKISLYIVPGVPEDFPFKTKTRKEISKIEWFRLTDLPTWKRSKAALGKFYLISPFIAPLKTFINQHKPRNLASKTPKYGAHQLQIDVSHASDQEVTQGSGSTETGELRTPSSRSTVIHQGITLAASAKNTAADQEDLDPHFARLLSSLTLSASNFIPPTQSVTGQHKMSAPTPLVGRKDPAHTSETSAPTTANISLPQRLFTSSHPLQTSTNNLQDTQRTNQATRSSNHQQPTASPAMPHPQDPQSPLPVATFPRVNVPHGSASTADISPYLTRPPTSAKTLKQLALLESVADESAKMGPILAQRDVALHSMTPAPLLLTFSQPHPRDLGILYSSKTPLPAPPFPMNSFSRPFPAVDPLHARAQTSFGFRDQFRHNNSMRQNQLLALINNRHANATPHHFPTPAPPTGSPSFMPPFANFPGSVPPLPQAGFHPIHPTNAVTTMGPPPVTMSPIQPQVLINPLLSIFNGNRTPVINNPGPTQPLAM